MISKSPIDYEITEIFIYKTWSWVLLTREIYTQSKLVHLPSCRVAYIFDLDISQEEYRLIVKDKRRKIHINVGRQRRPTGEAAFTVKE